jgi:hypothetical protein
MTGPAIDPLDALKALRGAVDPLEQLKALRLPGHDYHAEFQSGRLGKRMARENATDQEMADVEDEAAHIPATAGLAALSQGIPGAEAAQAGVRALTSHLPNISVVAGGVPLITPGDGPQSYREAYSDIHGAVDKVPGKTALKIVGSTPLAPLLPGGPAASGALLGGTTQALDANPETSIAGRVGRTAAGTVGGWAFGKGGELAVTGARAAAATPAATKLMEMKAARAAKAAATYAAALLQGKGRTNTPQIQAWLAKPDIAEIADELSQSRPFQGVARDDPRMLDGIYKVLSDRAQTVKKGLESVTPNRPNIGRFRGQDISRAQEELLNALDAPGQQTITTETAQSPPPSLRDAIDAFHTSKGVAAGRRDGTVMQQKSRELLERKAAQHSVDPSITGSRTQVVETPPPMPGYRQAVDQYADDSRNIDALRRGNDALRNRLSGVIPTGKNLDRTTPQALSQWAGSASLPERQSATAGVLGALKGQPKVTMAGKVLPWPSKALRATPDILRTLDPSQRTIDALIKAGLMVPNEMVSP